LYSVDVSSDKTLLVRQHHR